MDQASIRKIANAKYKNSPNVLKHVRMLQSQVAGYRLLALQHKGGALAIVSNKAANQIETALKIALETRGYKA